MPVVKIKEIKNLLTDFNVEVKSPDGWVPVKKYVEKGVQPEFLFVTSTGKKVRCAGKHLFETDTGWQFAEKLSETVFKVLIESGKFVNATIVPTGKMIPVVDVMVDHPNHRYYTNGVSSHNSGGGKSLVMCHMAAAWLKMGKNVLYVTMEMSERKIAERIDANLMNVPVNQLKDMQKDVFLSKVEKIKNRSDGRLFIKEYPARAAHVGHVRGLLDTLRIKKEFIPDVIIIDYLGICASSALKLNSNVNSYQYLKAISEEMRGLSTELHIPIVSASQVNRSAYNASDFELDSISDSAGQIHTADLILGIVMTEELDALGQVMLKQLKNRYGDPSKYRRFVIGIDKAKMQLYDLEEAAQNGVQLLAKAKAQPVVNAHGSSSTIDLESDNLFKKRSMDTSGFKF